MAISAMTGFRIGAASMAAQQRAIEVISHNLANLNTTAFDPSRVEFKELLQSQLEDGDGLGVAVGGIRQILRQGAVRPTGRALDVAIQGDGFFVVQLPDGRLGYTRNGSLQLGPGGQISIADGYALVPPLTVPEGAQDYAFQADGTLTVRMPGQDGWQPVGALQLARVPNPEGMVHVGRGVYVPTEASGAAVAAAPGQGGAGALAPGALEGSSVDLSEAMTDLIVAQRIYSLGVRLVQTADDMQRLANQLLG